MAASLFLASCTSTSTSLDAASAGLQPGLTTPQPANPPQTIALATNLSTKTTPTNPSAALEFTAPPTPSSTPGEVQVVAAPDAASQLDKNSKLVAAAAAASANSAENTTASAAPVVPGLSTPASAPDSSAAQVAVAPAAAVQVAASTDTAAKPLPTTEPAAAAPADTKIAKGAVLTAAPPAQQILTSAPAQPAPVKKKTLFGSLFASNKKPTAQGVAEAAPEPIQLALAAPQPPVKKAKIAIEPVLQPASLNLSKLEEPQGDAPAVDNGELPGVRKGALFEIKRRDSLQDDTDVDIGETDSGPVLLASAAGLARLAPNGLKIQRESVDVACLKPQLVKILKNIERHYSSTVVVTSGYRSPGYNRRVRGAKNSLHMFCAAADVQVAGVGKWELARYARSMAGRGGVGTYCHTDSVHIDVGPDRDWNWRCSRRK